MGFVREAPGVQEASITLVLSKTVIVFKGVGFGIKLSEWESKSDWCVTLGTFASLLSRGNDERAEIRMINRN